jgi:hypothetical protein
MQKNKTFFFLKPWCNESLAVQKPAAEAPRGTGELRRRKKRSRRS